MIRKQGITYLLLLLCLFLYLVGCTPRAGEQNHDVMAGTSWVLETDDSQMIFSEDKGFAWYQSKDEKDDNYYAGTYDFYMGQKAMDYLTGTLSEYGVTEEEMQQFFDRNEERKLDNLVCFTVYNNSFMLDGEEQLSEMKKTSYFGFLLNDGKYLDIASMDTGTYFGFLKE